MRVPKRGRAIVLATAGALVSSAALAGCGGSSGGSSADSKTVTVWTSVDQPIVDGFKKVLIPEAKAKGITVKIQKVENINQLIMAKLQANDAPDIAMVPQPGVVAAIVKRHKAFPLDDVVDTASLKTNMFNGALDAGTFDGKLYGLLVSSSVKSLVFYPKKAFDKAGYKAPTSLAELRTLTDKIAATGTTPWCFGIGSDAATGWPATDWMEDLVMRDGSVQDYQDWVTHKIKFDSAPVKKAAEDFQKIVLTNGHVYGGVKSVASTGFGDAPAPMFQAKQGCYMLKQGTFISTFFPKSVGGGGGNGDTDATLLDANVGTFPFPPATAGAPNPVLGAGDIATMLSNNASTKAVMKMMADPNLGKEAAKSGAFLAPFKNFDTAQYPNNIMKTAAKTASDASTFLFDASDSMPAEVGAGTFWKDMTAWISGSESLGTALSNIDASWPSS